MPDDVSCPDPNELVTRRILREELAKELSNYPTKTDLQEALSNYPTKADLREALSNYPTKAELSKAFADFAIEFRKDLVREYRVMQEQFLSEMRSVFDPHRDIPDRVKGLEGRTESLELRAEALEAPRRARARHTPVRSTKRKKR